MQTKLLYFRIPFFYHVSGNDKDTWTRPSFPRWRFFESILDLYTIHANSSERPWSTAVSQKNRISQSTSYAYEYFIPENRYEAQVSSSFPETQYTNFAQNRVTFCHKFHVAIILTNQSAIIADRPASICMRKQPYPRWVSTTPFVFSFRYRCGIYPSSLPWFFNPISPTLTIRFSIFQFATYSKTWPPAPKPSFNASKST